MRASTGLGGGEERGEVAMPHGGGAVAGDGQGATWRAWIGPGRAGGGAKWQSRVGEARKWRGAAAGGCGDPEGEARGRWRG